MRILLLKEFFIKVCKIIIFIKLKKRFSFQSKQIFGGVMLDRVKSPLKAAFFKISNIKLLVFCLKSSINKLGGGEVCIVHTYLLHSIIHYIKVSVPV